LRTASSWAAARPCIEKATIHEVRRAYKQIFEGEGSIRANAAAIRDDYAGSEPVMQILDFIAAESDRALSSPHRGSKG
jgi:UDP-N-acetylglucosamine acyltransferase